ncbi:MAG: hypothetical protein M3Y08_03960 [Fibrobacterota bacterium]|nr:hypothetical protein [Fibrobacterota bacterium]
MILATLFWVLLGLVVLVIGAALSMFLKRQGSGDRQSNDDSSPIYASGVYSLIRRSPRKELQEREPPSEEVQSVLSSEQAEVANGSAQQYLDEWRRQANLSINNIEKGDREGIQTYRYQVPAKCQRTCVMFSGDAYVTREQLHNHVQLIPPFHLGCAVELVTKEAWSAGNENAAWTPILPVNGKYFTPDWRIVVKL